jgi:hypothetical protein
MRNNQKDRAIATAVTGLIMDRLNKEEGPLGPLRDFHAKWLLEFTKWLFASDKSVITIDPTRKQIYLTPQKIDGKYLDKKTFDRQLKTRKVTQLSRRLPVMLGIDEYAVSFKRTTPRSSIKL